MLVGGSRAEKCEACDFEMVKTPAGKGLCPQVLRHTGGQVCGSVWQCLYGSPGTGEIHGVWCTFHRVGPGFQGAKTPKVMRTPCVIATEDNPTSPNRVREPSDAQIFP
jgi:hypothetical protein